MDDNHAIYLGYLYIGRSYTSSILAEGLIQGALLPLAFCLAINNTAANDISNVSEPRVNL